MRSSLGTTFRISLIAAAILAAAVGVVMALKTKHTGRVSENSRQALGRPLSALPPGAERTVASPHEWRGKCRSCHPLPAGAPSASPAQGAAPVPQGASGFAQNRGAAFFAGQPAAMNRPLPNAAQAAAAFPAQGGNLTDILTPAQQNAAGKALFEGHWLGMETMDLTAALRGIYKVPDNVAGVIVDEITLESAESGILAGDVIVAVNGWRTGNLQEFFQATMRVSGEKKAEVTVCRLGAQRRFNVVAKNSPILGFAQMEGAAPIQPGAVSPHKNRREACTACHVFMTSGGQLPTDAGDILPSPPPIAANARPAHAYKGSCNACHQIKR